jgi:hypothetical protein
MILHRICAKEQLKRIKLLAISSRHPRYLVGREFIWMLVEPERPEGRSGGLRWQRTGRPILLADIDVEQVAEHVPIPQERDVL